MDSRGRLSLQEYRAIQFLKNAAVLFTLGKNYGIIQLIDKLEFDSQF
jgi:hypothetical protein